LIAESTEKIAEHSRERSEALEWFPTMWKKRMDSSAHFGVQLSPCSSRNHRDLPAFLVTVLIPSAIEAAFALS
jgi:hypothetical protein